MPLFIVDGGEDGDDQDVDGRKEGGQDGDGPKLVTPPPTPYIQDSRSEFLQKKSVLRPILTPTLRRTLGGLRGRRPYIIVLCYEPLPLEDEDEDDRVQLISVKQCKLAGSGDPKS